MAGAGVLVVAARMAGLEAQMGRWKVDLRARRSGARARTQTASASSNRASAAASSPARLKAAPPAALSSELAKFVDPLYASFYSEDALKSSRLTCEITKTNGDFDYVFLVGLQLTEKFEEESSSTVDEFIARRERRRGGRIRHVDRRPRCAGRTGCRHFDRAAEPFPTNC